MASEFTFISRYFKDLTGQQGVALGIGDDAALINMAPGQHLVAATDTLVAGVHFPFSASAEQIATRALCVNLSDIAAMGAKPKMVYASSHHSFRDCQPQMVGGV